MRSLWHRTDLSTLDLMFIRICDRHSSYVSIRHTKTTSYFGLYNIYLFTQNSDVIYKSHLVRRTVWHDRDKETYSMFDHVCLLFVIIDVVGLHVTAPPPCCACRTAAFSPHSENMQGHSPLPPLSFNHSLALPVSFMSGARSF